MAIKTEQRDFPGGPVIKNLPYNAGDSGSIPGQGTKIPYAAGQLSPHAKTAEPGHCNRTCMMQPRLDAAENKLIYIYIYYIYIYIIYIYILKQDEKQLVRRDTTSVLKGV